MMTVVLQRIGECTTVTVKVLSTDPTGITLIADDICPATSVDLTVSGGTLGTGGVWEWSLSADFRTIFDNGTISVCKPADHNYILCKSQRRLRHERLSKHDITVKVLSTDPTGITLSADDVCPQLLWT